MARRNPKSKPAFFHNYKCDRPGINHVKQALRTPLSSDSSRLDQLRASIAEGVLSIASLAKLYNTSSSQVRRLRNHDAPFVTRILKGGRACRVI